MRSLLPRSPFITIVTFIFFFLTSLVAAQTLDNTTILPVGSCTATIPCANGACCNSVSGFCGFGQAFCERLSEGGPCSSNCDALAECGPDAAPSNFTCPLNVCCSQFGFCGTTDEFCQTGCQSHCQPPGQFSCGDDQQTALHRRIGYYEGWAVASDSRACDVYPPESISAETLTHVNFAFALISESFELQEMSVNDNLLWVRTTALKKRNAALKVFLSVGGWSFNDPPTQNIFSNLVGSDAATNTFITSALSVMQAYSFDGLDIDWEYPVAAERGGAPADRDNYPAFMAKVKAAFKPRGYGLSFTAPSSYWYLQHFDLPTLLQAADWVNVMTYDLHGVWDGTDPYIGPLVNAHTNLTEIKATMQLFRNVGIDPSQIVLGIGFYGRSFQLGDGSCSQPGCPFVGGADPGVCSLNSGTLMFSEIEQIINNNELVPTFDDVDAVKYITWNENQWVSYDDAQTLQMKLDYANSICLGGTMIWSVDQDDTSYTALKGLYADITINDPSTIEGGNMCQITGCGQGCPAGYDTLTTLTSVPNMAGSCDSSNPARLCCPPGDEPQNCLWRGGGGTSCNAQCEVGEILMALDFVGNDGTPTCVQGYKAFCCQSGVDQPGACFSGSCNADGCASPFVVQTRVKQGSADNGISCESSPVKGQVCPEICQSNTKPVCCEEGAGFTNCRWVGDPPNCLNAACSAGQVAIFSDMQGDASSSCVGNNKRFYCCDPPANAGFLPVPEEWVFPQLSPVGGEGYDVHQPATFTADFDDNTGTPDSSSTGSGSSGIGDDGKEDDSAFGEVFISSPNAGSVSSVDIASDWVITGCSATSDQPQEVLAYCSKELDADDSGCGHVLIGQAEHTIVRMPASCGLGPYARVASFAVHTDQDALPAEHKARKRSTEPVYSLKFDYNFLAIPESNGPVLMRADMTDIPGYWDEMINSAPDSSTTTTKHKRGFHQPHEYEKRWFGPFDDWLAKLTTVRSRNSIDRNFHWSDTYTIFHQEEQCPNFSSSLDISVSGSASVTSSFGYYLEASIVPPAIQQSYVFFQAGAQAQASFTIKGLAEAHFDSQRSELASFGFPGLYYPGLLTLGPSLHLYGQLSGQLSLSGQLTTSVGYTFPSIDMSFGKQDSNNAEDNASNTVSPDDDNVGYDFSVAYNVNLEGSLDAHLIPSLQLGISILGGALIDAQAFTEADIFAGVGITGSVSSSSAAQFCVNPRFGVNLNAGLTGSVLFWSTNPISNTFFSAEFPFGGSCFSSVDQGSGSGGTRKREENGTRYTYEAVGSAGRGIPINTAHNLDVPAYVALERSSSNSRKKSIQTPSTSWRINDELDMANTSSLPPYGGDNHSAPLKKRGGVPFLPGNLFCPTVGSDILDTADGAEDCICYSDSDDDDTVQIADIFNKRGLAMSSSSLSARYNVLNMSDFDPHVLETSKLKFCPTFSIPIPDYSGTNIVTYFDLENPGTLDPTYGTYNPIPINLGTLDGGQGALTTPSGRVVYGREHVYEQSMDRPFLNTLGHGGFCQWVDDNLIADDTDYFDGQSVFNRIGACYPGGADGADNMVLLEQNANSYKNKALYDMERQLNNISPTQTALMRTTSFDRYCATKKVARLRAAASVPSYMNDFNVKADFMRDNACIRAVWEEWYEAYLGSNVDAPNRANVNVPELYDNWIHDVVAGMVPYLRQQITALIARYNGPNNVMLSFEVLLDNWQITNRQNEPFRTGGVAFSQNVPVAQADLTAQILNAIPDINWVNQLPTH